MASTPDFVAYVCEQIAASGVVRSRKMFGDYMVYVNDKPLLLVCDNTVFVKMVDAVSGLLATAETGCPYDGAKPHYLLNIDDVALANAVIAALEPVTPLPKKRRNSTERLL